MDDNDRSKFHAKLRTRVWNPAKAKQLLYGNIKQISFRC